MVTYSHYVIAYVTISEGILCNRSDRKREGFMTGTRSFKFFSKCQICMNRRDSSFYVGICFVCGKEVVPSV